MHLSFFVFSFILILYNIQEINVAGIRKTLVKLSFEIKESPNLITNSEEYLFYTTKNIEILKISVFTFSFMSNRSFVNLTGCSNFKSVVKAIKLFRHYTGIKKIFKLKINTMSASTSRSDKMKKPSAENFYEITYQRFPGVVYKARDFKNGKYGCIFFSKNIVFFGLKSLEGIRSKFRPLFPHE